MAQRRLSHIVNGLASPTDAPVGTLELGGISYEVPSSQTPSRLPHCQDVTLDLKDPFTLDNLHFMLQKFLLGQDIFLLSQPGPYVRRLAFTFCR